MYKDTHKEAEKHIVQSDKSRASYYEIIANKKWGDKENNNQDMFKLIQPIELNLLDGQVELILRALELYGYNLEYMLNSNDATDEQKQEKISML